MTKESKAIEWVIRNVDVNDMNSFKHYPIEIAIPIEGNYWESNLGPQHASHHRVHLTNKVFIQHLQEQHEKILKLQAVYNKANIVAAAIGIDGQIEDQDRKVSDLLNAFREIDNGVFKLLEEIA